MVAEDCCRSADSATPLFASAFATGAVRLVCHPASGVAMSHQNCPVPSAGMSDGRQNMRRITASVNGLRVIGSSDCMQRPPSRYTILMP